MADLKISQLTGATTPLAGTEVVPLVQSSSTKKVSVADLTAGRSVSASTYTSTGKSAFGNGPLGRADVSVYYANRASNATTANLFVATSTAAGTDIGGSIAMGGAYDASADRIPFATWSGRKVNSSSTDYAGYALLTISTQLGGTVDALKVDQNGSLNLLTANVGINFTGNGGVLWRCGAGTPEGAVTAPVGSLFTRTDGGANTTLYVKESGVGNTGWVAK